MSNSKERASELLKEFKGDAYAFGAGVLDEAPGKFTAKFGKKAMFVGPMEFEWFQPIKNRILKSLDGAGVEVVDGRGRVEAQHRVARGGQFERLARRHDPVVGDLRVRQEGPGGEVVVRPAGGDDLRVIELLDGLEHLPDPPSQRE